MSDSLWPRGLCSPWNSLGQNTGVGSLSLLQGIFPTQGLNPGLPHCRWILYQLSHKGSPRILDRVACPFSRGSSWVRNLTGVSCIAGGFFTNWGIREFPRQEYWSGLPCPPPEDPPNLGTLGIELAFACVSCIAGGFFTYWATWEAHSLNILIKNIHAWVLHLQIQPYLFRKTDLCSFVLCFWCFRTSVLTFLLVFLTHWILRNTTPFQPYLNLEGNGNPLQYSCLENSMDRGAWWAPVHRVATNRTQLSDSHSLTYAFLFNSRVKLSAPRIS